jgi:tripartite-type tricarboxylate transporter receptor subunit TctC
MRRRLVARLAGLVVLALVAPAQGQGPGFYEGKTIRVIVGLAAGGGFDTYARLMGRHLGKHIPGKPAIIVENMPGAGGLIAGNHLYKVARPDGLTMAHFNGSMMMGQVLGQPGIEFDARKFEFLGALIKEDVVCGFTRASGITSIEKWMTSKTPVKLGGVSMGSPVDNSAKILRTALGLPVQVVSGYKGTAEIRLAADAGELAGACWAWESMRATWRSGLESGQVVVVLQLAAKAFPELAGVPLAMSLAKTDEARQLIQMAHHASAYARPFYLPPGVPKDRVRILRTAFEEMQKDKAFLAEADKMKLTIEPVTGDDLTRMVHDLFTLDPTILARLKDVLYKP